MKEDSEPYFNCKSSELSFYYRALAWCTRTPTFQYTDPFVLEHCNRYRFIQEMHREVRSRQCCARTNVKSPKVFWPSWALKVLLSIYEQFLSRKAKALYIYGTSGVGKTFIVRKAFASLGYTCKYMPLPRTFFMGTFDPSTHDHIVFEEWDYDVFRSNYSQIKQLLDREGFPVDSKNRDGRSVKVECPVVFISNFSPYTDRAFRRRYMLLRR
jgi:hypothetical protein